MKRGAKGPNSGSFKPGQSGNPGGLPKNVTEIRAIARQYTETAIKTLVKVARHGKSESARVAAAEAILDRGYGRPTQPIEGKLDFGKAFLQALQLMNGTVGQGVDGEPEQSADLRDGGVAGHA